MEKPFGKLDHDVCLSLRWKSMFIEADTDPTVPPSNDRSFWCVMTQVCLGPDGRVANPEDCHSGRKCYDPLSTLKFT